MPNCPECGAQIEGGQKVCPNCGARLTLVATEFTAQIDILKKKIEQDSLNPKLYFELGDFYEQNDYLQEALIEYQKAISINDSYFEANLKSGNVCLELKEFEKAENYFRKALSTDPNSIESALGLLRIYHFQGKIDVAINLGEKLSKADPKNLRIHQTLKDLYFQKGEKEKALNELEILSSLMPQDKQLYKELAYLYKEKNENKKNLQCYQKILEIDPEDTDAHIAMAIHFYKNGDYNKTIECLKDFPKKPHLSPDTDSIIRAYLALAYINNANLTYAKNLLEEITPNINLITLETKKIFAEVYYRIGNHDFQEMKSDEAVYFLEKATQFWPENIEYRKQLNATKGILKKLKWEVRKRTIIIMASAIAAIVMIIVGWNLTHNKVLIQINPPEEAQIYIDGKQLKGRSKKTGEFFSSSLSMGAHKIVIKKNGYERWEGIASIGFGEKATVVANLVPIYGSLKVNSEPSNAHVYLDGKHIGETPFTSEKILATSHRIEIEIEGYKKWNKAISVNRNETVDLAMIYLKNLIGTWRGKIGEEAYLYKPDFTMKIKQKENTLTIKYFHQLAGDRSYSGEIKGKVSKNKFFAEGIITFKFLNIFYWAKSDKKLTMQGTISEDWNRIEGAQHIEGFGDHRWWVVRQ